MIVKIETAQGPVCINTDKLVYIKKLYANDYKFKFESDELTVIFSTAVERDIAFSAITTFFLQQPSLPNQT